MQLTSRSFHGACQDAKPAWACASAGFLAANMHHQHRCRYSAQAAFQHWTLVLARQTSELFQPAQLADVNDHFHSTLSPMHTVRFQGKTPSSDMTPVPAARQVHSGGPGLPAFGRHFCPSSAVPAPRALRLRRRPTHRLPFEPLLHGMGHYPFALAFV